MLQLDNSSTRRSRVSGNFCPIFPHILNGNFPLGESPVAALAQCSEQSKGILSCEYTMYL